MPVRARALALASLLAASAVLGAVPVLRPAPVAAAAPKVAIIVGPVGSLTPNYRNSADRVADAAIAAGATVVKAYSPKATWSRVRSAVDGANVVVYFGHGNGYPNPYTSGYEYTDRVNGFGLNRTTRNGDSDNWSTTMVYCGEKALLGTLSASDGAAQRQYCGGGRLTPAPGFTMVYAQAHYAPGFGERYQRSDPRTTLDQAQQRVRNYSYPMLRLGAGAYFATAYGDADEIVTRVLTQPTTTYGDIFRAGDGYSATEAHRDGPPRRRGRPRLGAEDQRSRASTSGRATTGTRSRATTGGSPGLESAPFSDIAGSRFYDDIVWLSDTGITTGCGGGRFCPNSPVSRGQLATFLVRALDLPPAVDDYFDDDDGTTHEAAINSLAAAGITDGCGAGRYCPDRLVRRDQMATFLSRALAFAPTDDRLLRRRRRVHPRAEHQSHRGHRRDDRLRALDVLPGRPGHARADGGIPAPGARLSRGHRTHPYYSPDHRSGLASSRMAHHLRRSAAACLAAVLLVLAAAPVAAVDPSPAPTPEPPDAGGPTSPPSIHAEMESQHAATPISFVSGARPTGLRAHGVDGGEVQAEAAALPNGLSHEVFGYLPYWAVTDPLVAHLDYDLLSTIAYFGVPALSNGTLQKTGTGWNGWTSATMTDVINEAHAEGVKVVLTVTMMAWDYDYTAMSAVLNSAHRRTKLADDIAATVAARNADGVNLDFEPMPNSLQAAYTAFVRAVRAALGSGSYLTVATTGGAASWDEGYDLAGLTASDAANALMVMAYDLNWSGSARAGGVAPIDSPYALDSREAMAAYRARVPSSKLIWGVPYYGRAWTTTTKTVNGRDLRERRWVHRGQLGDAVRRCHRGRGRPWPPVGRDRPGSLVHVSELDLRHPRAGLLRRRPVARRQVRDGRRQWAARRRHLAPPHGRRPSRAVGPAVAQLRRPPVPRCRRLGIPEGHHLDLRGRDHHRLRG